MGVQEVGMALAVLQPWLAALNGLGIDGVEALQHGEHLVGEVEERCRVVFLLEV